VSEDFLHTWESIEDGHIKAIVCGEKITIEQAQITQQFGISAKGIVNVVNALIKGPELLSKT
jgi:hypothetical protein